MKEARGQRVVRALVRVLSIVHVLLALNFFPLVPFLGWLNFGHASWATAWIPEVVMLLVLPAGYFIHWHFWFVVAGAPLLLSVYWWRRGRGREARAWTVVNGVAMVMVLVVRVVLQVLGVRPDIV